MGDISESERLNPFNIPTDYEKKSNNLIIRKIMERKQIQHEMFQIEVYEDCMCVNF